MVDKYKNLFSEGRIGRLVLKNRYVMSPAETLYASVSGEVTPQIIEFYRRRAKGGVGLIILHSVQGNSHIDPLDPYAGSLRIDNNAYIPMMSDLVEAVHNEGAKIACLVSIGGGAKGAGEEYADVGASDRRRVAPSYLPESEGQPECRGLEKTEIKQIIENYGRCAWRAKVAGFDAFYIHALGSYLLAEFLSPLFNHRTDEYGGTAENRWRILFELIESCQRQAGKDFPIIVRLSLDEMHEQGRSLEESLEFLPRLETMGVAALDVTAGLMDVEHRSLPSMYTAAGINRPYLEAAKKVVGIPIIHSGHMKDPDLAERFLSEGVVDFISVSRALIADPDLPNKVMEGKGFAIRKCLSCNYCIGHRIMQRLPIRCAFNPYVGHESTESEEIPVASTKRRIIVVGAGPAGLEAARVLAKKGHQVDLFEKGNHFCCYQIEAAVMPPCKSSLSNISEYYEYELGSLENVHIHFNQEFTISDAHNYSADCIFIATGAQPIIPRIPGIDGENVVLSQNVLLEVSSTGKTVVVLGGGQIGAETAHYLANKGCDVSIVDQLPQIAVQEEPLTRGVLLHLLEEAGVKVFTGKRVVSLSEKAVSLIDFKSGKKEVLYFDTAVIAFGTKPDCSLFSSLKAEGFSVKVIGDALKVGNIATAIANAHYIAKEYE
ncbi:MAG: FAD-dependent oxidoreductase [Spirochaetales bacterium]|nr:FAD-dependent oxidoreductase [Spirochaetales bacterium]